jgi:hypothetical protein
MGNRLPSLIIIFKTINNEQAFALATALYFELYQTNIYKSEVMLKRFFTVFDK